MGSAIRIAQGKTFEIRNKKALAAQVDILTNPPPQRSRSHTHQRLHYAPRWMANHGCWYQTVRSWSRFSIKRRCWWIWLRSGAITLTLS